MIVYGTKAKQIGKEILTDKCPNCGTQNSLEVYLFQKYAHVFWIPFFPIGKTGISQCEHCKQVLKSKEMPPALSAAYDTLKAQSRTPVWTFAGVALVAVIITIGIISSRQNDAQNLKFVQQPQQGDVLEVRTSDKNFTLYKVEGIEGDSVILRINQYETNKKSGLKELKEKGNAGYSEDLYSFSKTELKNMLEKGDIIDVDRK